jgi:hypothetical protein
MFHIKYRVKLNNDVFYSVYSAIKSEELKL